MIDTAERVTNNNANTKSKIVNVANHEGSKILLTLHWLETLYSDHLITPSEWKVPF